MTAALTPDDELSCYCPACKEGRDAPHEYHLETRKKGVVKPMRTAVEVMYGRIEALEAELAACKRGAGRYLYLRSWDARKGTPKLYVSDGNSPLYEQELDAAIDAAMAAGEKA